MQIRASSASATGSRAATFSGTATGAADAKRDTDGEAE